MKNLADHRLPFLHVLFSSRVTNQVILVGTLTGVQGDIRCKVLATLATVKKLELELA